MKNNQSLAGLFKRVLFDALAPAVGKSKDAKPINIGEIVGAVSVKTADANIKRIIATIGDSASDAVMAQLKLAVTAADADPEEKEEKEEKAKAADTDDPDKEKKASDMDEPEEKKKTGDSIQKMMDAQAAKLLNEFSQTQIAYADCRSLVGDMAPGIIGAVKVYQNALSIAGVAGCEKIADCAALSLLVKQQVKINDSASNAKMAETGDSGSNASLATDELAKIGVKLNTR